MSKQLSRNTLILSLALLLTAVANPLMAQQRRASTNAFSQQSPNESATTVFRAARDLITDGEWAKAQDKFREYVDKYQNEKNLDAALYWLAYSQHKLARYDQVRETLGRLFTKYQNSSWLDDARVLMAQIPNSAIVTAQAEEVLAARLATAPVAIAQQPEPTIVYTPGAAISTVGVTPLPPGQITGTTAYALGIDGLGGAENDDDPCEFKIVVLQALFQTDVQRGIVAATDWLKPGSNQTVRCKGAALSLLGRHGGKAVTPVILGLARNEPDLKLRARAISTLGTLNDDSVIDALREFALNSTETTITEAALYALSRHTNERVIGVLSDIAVSGKTTAQRKAAIASIASRAGEPAVDALFRIYDADQTVEIRKAVIAGFANRKSERAGTRLFEIARSSDNIELRKAAISGISRRGGDKAIEFLLSLYDTEKNDDVKDQIIGALAGNWVLTPTVYGGQTVLGTSGRVNDQRVIKKLIDIARNPQESMVRRKRAIGWLSRSNDPQVQRFLEELLK